MNKLILTAGAVAALTVAPLLTLGADPPPPVDAGMMKVPPNAISFMCRVAGANEKPTGTIGGQSVVCRSMEAMMTGGMMKVPQTTGMSGMAADQAWRNWLTQVLILTPRSGDG